MSKRKWLGLAVAVVGVIAALLFYAPLFADGGP